MVERKMIQDGGDRKWSVTLNVSDEGLAWTGSLHGVLIKNVLKYSQVLGARVTSLDELLQTQLSVHYVKVVVGKDASVVLRHATVSFLASDVICDEVSRCIDKHLKHGQSHRPRRVLIFANPMSGSQDSVTSYTHVVQPLFDVADITVHCVVTENKHHANNVLSDYDLLSIDAVVSMGGDGSYGHVFTGLMQKTMKDAGVDMYDETVEPVTPRVAFGVLPTGSGCAMARAANSCVDLETCVLSIILGRTQRADLGVVRHGTSFVRYCLFTAASGTLINAFSAMDEHRWLKKARYFLTIPAIWREFCMHDVEIQYRPVLEHQKLFRYTTPADPSAEYPECSTVDGPQPGWKTFRGKVSSVGFSKAHTVKFLRWLTVTPYIRPITSSGIYRMSIDKVNSFWALLKLYIKFVKIQDVSTGGRAWIPRELMEQPEVTEIHMRVLSDCQTNGNACVLHLEGETTGVLDYSAKMFEKKFNMFVIDHDLVSEALQYANLDSP